MSEILAPVGSVEALKTAIFAGADAVYLGLDLFNARIKADNFTLDNIKDNVDLAHLFGVKVYVAFNINIKNSEMNLLEQYVKVCAEAHVDAFIVTDLGAMDIYRKYKVPLHASTQMGIHNLYGAKIIEKLGFTRVVLSRETLEKDIMDIKQHTNLEIEYFVHGALCVCFSGGCLLSSFMNGDSGNRGRCNQPCRLPYISSLSNKGPQYLLSASDQCLIEKIDRLKSLGVDSFKIEGRLKQPHYIGEVVSIYRQILDKKSVFNADKRSRLLRAFNRGGFTKGYNYDLTKDIMSPNVQGNLGEYIGDVVGNKNKCIVIQSNKQLHNNDGVKFIQGGKELFGMSLKNIICSGKNILIPCNKFVKPGAKLYLTLDSTQVERYNKCSPKLYCDVNIDARVGKKIKFSISALEHKVTINGDFIEESLKYQINKKNLLKNIDKFGTSNFTLRNCNMNVDDNAFIPASLINSLRREAIMKLENEIIYDYELKQKLVDNSGYKDFGVEKHKYYIDKNKIFAEFDLVKNITSYVENVANVVINLNDFSDTNLNIVLEYLLNYNKNHLNINNCYIKLPKIARANESIIIYNFINKIKDLINGIVCENLYAVCLAKVFQLNSIGGIGLNLYNDKASQVLGLDYSIASIELNNKELNELKNNFAIFAYGNFPVMTFTHCPIQLNTGCNCSNCKYNGDFYYKDKLASYLIKRTKIKFCYFNMYNPNIMDIRGKFDKLPYNYYLNFEDLNSNKIELLLNNFINRNGEKDPNATNGHYFRGVN